MRSSTARSSPLAPLALLVGVLGFVAAFAATTQYVAHAFGYARVLGLPLFGHVYQPLASAVWLVNLDMRCVAIAHWRHFACPARTTTFLGAAHAYLLLWLAGASAVTVPLAVAARFHGAALRRPRGRRIPAIDVDDDEPAPLRLTVGTSTGKLLALGHGAAIRAGERVHLVGDEASQNILVLGGTGSGKTTRSLNNMCAEAALQDCGILALNVKGDWDLAFREIARRAGRRVEEIGIGATPLNLLDGLSPEIAASYIKSALLLAGNTSGDNAFWNELATELARNVLGVLSFRPQHYTLTGLFNYLFVETFRTGVDDEVNAVYAQLTRAAGRPVPVAADPDTAASAIEAAGIPEATISGSCTIAPAEPHTTLLAPAAEADDDTQACDPQATAAAEAALRRLERYANYYSGVFATFDEKVRNGVRAQLSQVLSLFTLPELEEAFCTPGVESALLERLVDGAVFLVNLPIQRYGLCAKTVYTFIKLRFFSVMNERRIQPAWNQTRSVVFICDEYQEIVSIAKDALSDLNFWSLSRSARTVGIISGQGIESFRAAIGNQSLTDAFLQNFRQKICYATEDEATIKFFTYLLGQVEVERENSSRSKSRSSGPNASTSSQSQSTSHQRQLQSTINPQFFRQLRRGEVLAVLSIGGEACDDVIATQPLYIEPPAVVELHAAPVNS